ncbi:MAG TPA: type II secretion system F family protein [Solirubrobacteraceae bacterium]|jgi:type IV pilus assembly protein PilC|nr:type II secretion system F family protein [Solirubrobacteraceae bacterium]
MSTYVFKALDLAGGKAKGELEAESKQAVADQLKQRGLIVLDIADKRASTEINIGPKRVPANELAIFARQLSTMISSGMSILRALYVLEEQTESKFLKETIVAVRKDVEAGLSLSDSMARHPKVFSPLFVAMTQAGETGGVLEGSLVRVADQLQKDAALKRQVKSAMVFPSLVMVVAVGVMLALVAFLIPVFEGVFKEFGGHLPALTQVSVDMSHFVTKDWWALIIIPIVVVVAFMQWKKTTWGRKQWDHFRLHVPMKIGAIVQQVAVARWSRTLASLTAAGVPLLQALEITGRTGGNSAVHEAMEGVIASVKRGGTIAAPLAQAPIFPSMVTHMVGVGEETGALDEMLDRVAEFYEEQVESSVKALMSIIEPIMIMVIGAMVGFIVISMYLPLFEVYNHIES